MADEEGAGTTLYLAEVLVENVKRIRMVRIKPHGNTILIAGENEQGKSSFLDAIAMMLGGKREFEEEPLRHGARQGRVVGDFGEFVVERRFSSKGTTELKITKADGAPVPSPQSLLDELCARYMFDPLDFFMKSAEEQDSFLRDACGLDFSDLENEEAVAREKRRLTNGEIKRLKTQLEVSPLHADAPKVPVDVAETAVLLEERSKHNEARAARVVQIENDRKAIAHVDKSLGDLARRIKELEDQREAMVRGREELEASVVEAEQTLPPEMPVADLRDKLLMAETINTKIRENAAYHALERQIRSREDAADAFDIEVRQVADRKAERLAKTVFPVPGLSFDENGWRFQNVPISQASQAQKLRLGVAFGVMLKPRIKIMLLRQGSALGENMLGLVAELAEQNQLQVFIERVGKTDAGAIIIENGELLGDGSTAAA